MTPDEAGDHCARGLGIWDWASNDQGDPDVVIGCAGDVPTLEALAATAILREQLPDLRVRFINVVDLMRLQDDTEHPHGLSHRDFDALFTPDKPVDLRLPRVPVADPPADLPAHQPRQHPRPRLQGGGHHLDPVRHGDDERHGPVPPGHRRHRPRPLPGLRAALLRQQMVDARAAASRWTREHGDDIPSVRDWTWPDATGTTEGASGTALGHQRGPHPKRFPTGLTNLQPPGSFNRSGVAGRRAAPDLGKQFDMRIWIMRAPIE